MLNCKLWSTIARSFSKCHMREKCDSASLVFLIVQLPEFPADPHMPG